MMQASGGLKMITPNDVVQAVSALLLQYWPKTTIYIDVVYEGSVRPSFLVESQGLRMAPAESGSVDLVLPVRVVCFEKVDDYHDSQLARLSSMQMQVMALFAQGYLKVKDRAPHVTQIVGGQGGRDFSDVTLTLEWNDSLEELLPPEPPVPLMSNIEMRIDESV